MTHKATAYPNPTPLCKGLFILPLVSSVAPWSERCQAESDFDVSIHEPSSKPPGEHFCKQTKHCRKYPPFFFLNKHAYKKGLLKMMKKSVHKYSIVFQNINGLNL